MFQAAAATFETNKAKKPGGQSVVTLLEASAIPLVAYMG